jgi:urea transport system permease protein
MANYLGKLARGCRVLGRLLVVLSVLVGLAPSSSLGAAEGDQLGAALEALKARSYRDVEQAIRNLALIDNPRVEGILHAMLEGDLYYRLSDGRVVVVTKAEGKYRLTDAVNGTALGTAGRFDVKKVRVNNHLRGVLRDLIARRNLDSKDPQRRLNAVREMTGDSGAAALAMLREAAAKEHDADVKRAIAVALALNDLHSDDGTVRLKAVQTLDGSVEDAVRNALARMLIKNDDGVFAEPDARVRAAAAKAMQDIRSKLDLYNSLQTVYFGISLGSVLLLSAIGLAITFGVMGVINMAHGELMMLGAYTTYVVQQLMPDHIEYSLPVAIPAAFLISGAVGMAIERGVIRFLYGRPLETLLATFGISLVLQQAVRTIFSPLNRSVATPSWMSGAWEINSALSFTYNRLYIIIFALLVFAALLLILKKTPLGLQVRAVSQNRAMARAMGVRSEWVDALTFGLGSGIAGIAGVALSQLTNVGPNLGQSYIIDSFMVVVFGGVGNLWGTLVGALALGIGNKFLEPWSGAVLGKILLLVFIILFIQRRPRGLFPQKGRAAEV